MDYKLYKSKFIIDNQEELVSQLEYIHMEFEQGGVDSTWSYSNYNIFALTSPSALFYKLFNELKTNIRDYVGHDKPLWLQSWMNFHNTDNVLDWHDHYWPYHGYIAIDPKETKTIFESGYEIINEVGNIYIGPGHNRHKVEVIKPFKGPRITLGFDIHEKPMPSFKYKSLFPI